MQAFTEPLQGLREFEELSKKIKKHTGLFEVTGCMDSQKLQFALALGGNHKKRLFITYNDTKAREMYEDCKLFDKDAVWYPARDFIFYSADIQGNLITGQRMQALKAILEKEEVTVITTIDGCMDHLMKLSEIEKHILHIDFDSIVNIEKLKEDLIYMGYERTGQVESRGQFAIRGGIIDVFPLTEENPYRIELWDDEVDSIRSFDAQSQRSIENLEEIFIYPAAELLLTKEQTQLGLAAIEKEAKAREALFQKELKTEEAARVRAELEDIQAKSGELGAVYGADGLIHYFLDETVSFLDYFTGEEAVIFLDEPNRILEKGETVELEFRESMKNRLEKGYILPKEAEVLYGIREIAGMLNRKNCTALCTLELKANDWDITDKYFLNVRSISSYQNDFEQLIKDLKQWKKNGYRVIFLSGSRTRAQRLALDLQEQGLNSFYSEDLEHEVKPGEIMTAYGNLHRGYEYPMIKFAVISEGDVFGREKKKRKKRKRYEGEKIADFNELKIGDYVVHENHGLGIYKGIEKVEVEKLTKDYIKIEYGNGGNLYIPATQLDMIQKYSGSEGKQPKLNRLGTQEWTKTKTKVRGAVKDIAKDLVALYAARQEKTGYVYGEDTVWQREFEEMFPFEETEDQLLAIEAVKRDMESKKIMDRLICGDVGYGKTEVAIRAAFKAVQEGKQVVYLVPTTILAQQHYNTFAQRMKDFPVRVDLLCRFRTPGEQKKTLADLKKGMVDIVIGTHRVLSSDVVFKDLGLLIVDEEQRFGVAHKEKIKKLKENVDVLTLTATPIPRTLHMSLIGIRDMSVLEEAPMDRTPIQTYVMEYNDEMVREAIERELARNGQVYYVYNRVRQIDEVAAKISALVPDANVAFAHGQMKEHELERIMYDFINGDIDVLVSTTIIETGLDISNVNTMIIHDADQLGLSQLYQLRGRVGRSNRTAYAFLMYRRNKLLKEVAEKRLSAIREFTELGSGIKIAMRDLEIRGAGNLLGASQHGHMEAVGYDLYCKMLNQAVKELKGEQTEETFDTVMDLDMDAYIPDKYISNEYQKLDMYKRISGIENEQEQEDMTEELLDRYGELPKAVENLLLIAMLRAQAHKLWLTEIKGNKEQITFLIYQKAAYDITRLPEFLEHFNGNLQFRKEGTPCFIYQKKNKAATDNKEPAQIVKEILNAIEEILLTNGEP